MNDFGKALRQCRRQSGKTLEDVARHLNCSIPYVSDVERGNRAPFPVERIRQLATFLGADEHVLLIAASTSRGSFELDARTSEKHESTGALLMRGWTDLSPEDLDGISQIVRKKVAL